MVFLDDKGNPPAITPDTKTNRREVASRIIERILQPEISEYPLLARKVAYRASRDLELLFERECSSARQEAFREAYNLLVQENKRIDKTLFKVQLAALVAMVIFTVLYAVKLFV